VEFALRFTLWVGRVTGQLLPGVGPGPLALSAEHPEVASKVRYVAAWLLRAISNVLAAFMCVSGALGACWSARKNGEGDEQVAQAGSDLREDCSKV
jgi:hypothetical protein